jgi:glycosyltransferase involved in cell wall biosynthesis
VAFCIDNMNVGGTEMNAVRTAERLVQRGVELRVFSLATQGPLLERYAELSVPVHFLPLDGLFSRSALRRGRELAGFVRAHRIDIVHAHDVYSNIFAAPWARMAGAAFVASRRWWAGSDRASKRIMNRLAYILADRVVANSPSIATWLWKSERVRRGAITVIPNFLEEAAFRRPAEDWMRDLASDLRLPAVRRIVGVVASLQPIKNHGMLLRAVAVMAPAYPDLVVVLVGGDSGSRSELERLAAELGIYDRVRFAGLRPSIPSPHHLFDVSALTSNSEGMPNSVLEAMAAGRPVVATNVGAVSDVVDDGVTGYLVEPGDVAALADRLGRLLDSADLRAQMGAAGQAAAARGHMPDAAIERLLALYAELQGGRAHG